jgi:excisionase family DNA binding protein
MLQKKSVSSYRLLPFVLLLLIFLSPEIVCYLIQHTAVGNILYSIISFKLSHFRFATVAGGAFSLQLEQLVNLIVEKLKQEITSSVTEILDNRLKSIGEGRDNEQLLNISEATQLLCVSKSTLYKLQKEESLPSYKIGDSIRFSKTELLQFVQKYKQETKKNS